MAAQGKPRKGERGVLAPPRGWKIDPGGRSWSLRLTTVDFLEAVEVIKALARVAEAVGHHPDFHLERWNRLRITTYSHDVGRLTARDLRLARAINAALSARK